VRRPDKFLLLPVCGLGDAVCYIPFVIALRKEFPDAEIVVIVATASAKEIITGSLPSTEVIVFNRRLENGWLGLLRLVNALRKRRFDVVISGAHISSVRVPLLAYFCGRNMRIGANEEPLSFLYNRTVRIRTDAHAFERYRQLLTAVGIHMSFEQYFPTVTPPQEAEASAAQLWTGSGLDQAESVIGMASGADLNPRGGWVPSLKRWKLEGYAEVALLLAKKPGVRIVMFGTSEEGSLASEVARISGVPIVNMCGRTGVKELQWLLHKCTAFVSNDTGTMHLASALGTPVVALFGPTSHESFGPLGTMSRTIQGHAHCSPCYPRPTCNLGRCIAMEDISSTQVIQCLLSILETRKGTPLLHITSSEEAQESQQDKSSFVH